MKKTNNICLIIAFISLCIALSYTQNICSNCIDVNSNNFTCNNIGCNGFMLTPNQNNSLNFNTINCIGGGSQCYYTSQTPVASNSFVVYIFCNNTFPGCTSCLNSATCNQCQNGYFANVYDPTLELVNCELCAEFIGGCQQCSTSTQCQQCSSQFLNIFGFCYTPSGSIIGDTKKPWNKLGSTATQIVSTIEVIIICIILYFVLYKFCCAKLPKNESNQGFNQMNSGFNQPNLNELNSGRTNY